MNKRAVSFLIVSSGLALSACTVSPAPATTPESIPLNKNTAPASQEGSTMDTSNLPSAIPEFKFEDQEVGTGATAQPGQDISVHYTGVLLNGKVFDSSLRRGQPFTFTLGAGQVIEGWDQGFTGMRVGGKRRLFIPSDMAYGSNAVGNYIPANSDLVFDVELVAVEE